MTTELEGAQRNSEALEEMEPLVLLPETEWPQMRDSFLTHRTYGLVGYNLIQTQILIKAKGRDCNFRVYCPYGEVSNGLVAKITKHTLKQLIIMANSEDTSKLEEALLRTRQIDWAACRIEVPFVQPLGRECLMRVAPILGLKLTMEGPSDSFAYNRNRQMFEISFPNGTYVSSVKHEQVRRVDEVWPQRYENSDWVFHLFIDADLSYGLYRIEDDSLIAWLFVCEAGFLCHLYCEEEHRRCGYAEFMVKYVTNELLRKGFDSFCYVVKGNIKSFNLFTKIGFEKYGKASWMYFDKDISSGDQTN